jgi:class 3 adenylate cyclase/tetratricopeptide (TPR) repeat protein
MDSIREWLERHGLTEFASVFEEERIDFETLPELTDLDLKDLGLPLGPRRKLLKAIRELQGEPTTAPSPIVDAVASSEVTPRTGAAERRQLTVMFADLVGSTELSQQLDPEDLREINRAYQDAAKTMIESYGGFVARYMGDGVLAYFGYPQAHEDDAERAVRVGLGLTDAVPRLAGLVKLSVRIGIATGPVVVGDIIGEGASQESAVVGETPNLAARLQGIADENSVVIGDQTRRLTAGVFHYVDLGARSLKGFAELTQAWEVRGEAALASRFEEHHGDELGAFVGREHDLGMLLERWERVIGGEGQAVLVTGEAGIGKSRVTNALRGQISSSAHLWVSHQCSPHHTNSALHPFISQLERAARFDPHDDDEAKLQKLDALLARSRKSADSEALHLLAELLSLSTKGRLPSLEFTPQEQKAKTFDALMSQLAGLSIDTPVLWVFEDAHWADPTTRELLEYIIDHLQNLPVLAVITARPEYEPDWVRLGQASMLPLGRLSRTQSTALVESQTDGRTLPDVVLEQIIEKTDGVPLFVEELTKAVLESGLLVRRPDRYELVGSFGAVAIPSTLQDSLMARLDRLGDAKGVAQTAAALGREFQRELLSRVMFGQEAFLERSLAKLVEAGMLFRRGVAPADRYMFKHGLVQDVALDSMLRKIRQAVNKRIAEVLESEYPTVRETQPEVLAHHFSEAGEVERAIAYLQQAGRRDAQRSAYVETISHLSQALQLLNTLPESVARDEQELTIQSVLGPAQMPVLGFASESVEQTYNRARELCEKTGKTDQLFQTLYGLFRLRLIRAQYDSASVLAKTLLAQAEREENRVYRLTAHRAIGNSALWLSEVGEALPHLERGASLYDREADRGLALVYGDDPGVDFLSYAAVAHWWLGRADQAVALRDESLVLARDLSHPFSLGRALMFSCIANCCMRRIPVMIQDAQEMLDLSSAHGMVIWKSMAEVMLGIGQVHAGNTESGSAQIDLGLERYYATGARLGAGLWPAFVAQAHVCNGEVGAGLNALKSAMDADDNMRLWDAELHRLKGDLDLRSKAAQVRIEASYQQALSVSRGQGARALELRAATSLARFWWEHGKQKQAVDLLAPVYQWFTEGFDTPDLVDARKLLNELS